MQVVKARSRRLTEVVESFTDAHAADIGTVQRVCVVDTAAKPGHLVAHNKAYTQVRTVTVPRWPALLWCTCAVLHQTDFV